MPLTDRQRRSDILALLAQAAVQSERRFGVPAELTVAQALLETGWKLNPPGNNFFGIKRAARHTDEVKFKTTEYIKGEKQNIVDRFAAYDSMQESFDDHAWLISQGVPYTPAWTQYIHNGDLTMLIRDVAKVYATDPGYATKLLALVGMKTVQQYIAIARDVAQKA